MNPINPQKLSEIDSRLSAEEQLAALKNELEQKRLAHNERCRQNNKKNYQRTKQNYQSFTLRLKPHEYVDLQRAKTLLQQKSIKATILHLIDDVLADYD